jgi:hypothetical protein
MWLKWQNDVQKNRRRCLSGKGIAVQRRAIWGGGCLRRIAIIDTAIDPEYIGGRSIEHFNLCGINNHSNYVISHGTLCAMVLDACASDYELVNIQIFRDNKIKVFGEIALLAEALKLCRELKVDVVSLSAVSSVLSDSKYLYDITRELARNTVIVSALDNGRYVTVPTSYPHVLGVMSDVAGLLSPGEIAYHADDPFCANIYANCDFPFLRERHYGPSNSMAVPVVAAYVNDMLNRGQSIPEIESLLRNLDPYPMSKEQEAIYYPVRPIEKEIPVVFLADETTEKCGLLMNSMHEKYEVQSTALSLVEGPYDVRIKTVKDLRTIKEDLHFMEHHYKTDMIFIIGRENLLDEIQKKINIDVKLICRDGRTWINYDNGHGTELNSEVSDRLYEILTT